MNDLPKTKEVDSIINSAVNLNVHKSNTQECKKILAEMRKKMQDLNKKRIEAKKEIDLHFNTLLNPAETFISDFDGRIKAVEMEALEERLSLIDDLIRSESLQLKREEYPKSWFNKTKKIEDIVEDIADLIDVKKQKPKEKEVAKKVEIYEHLYSFTGTKAELLKLHSAINATNVAYRIESKRLLEDNEL